MGQILKTLWKHFWKLNSSDIESRLVSSRLLMKLALPLMDFSNVSCFHSKWGKIKFSWDEKDLFELIRAGDELPLDFSFRKHRSQKHITANINQNLADIRRTRVDTHLNTLEAATRWVHDDASKISLRLRFINERRNNDLLSSGATYLINDKGPLPWPRKMQWGKLMIRDFRA